MVYKARDTRLGVKSQSRSCLRAFPDRDDVRERFEREARAISSLSHPHICPLYDVGSQDGIDYLVMEYLEGETLAHRHKKGAMPLEQTLRYDIEIASALDAAHGKGITRRDIIATSDMNTWRSRALRTFCCTISSTDSRTARLEEIRMKTKLFLSIVLFLVSMSCGGGHRKAEVCEQRTERAVPLFVTLSLQDSSSPSAATKNDQDIQLAALNFFALPNTDPKRSGDLEAVRKFYETQDLKWNQQEIEAILKAQRDRRAENDFLSAPGKVNSYSFGKTVDLAIQYGSKNPRTRFVNGLLKDAAQSVVEWYYKRETEKRDALLLQQFRENLSNLPHAERTAASDIQKYFLAKGDRLLGSALLQNLRNQGLTPAEVEAVEHEYISRLLEIAFTQRKQSSATLSASDIQELGKWEKEHLSLKGEITSLSHNQKQLLSSLKGIDGELTGLQDIRADVSASYSILVSMLPASEQLKTLESRGSASMSKQEHDHLVSALRARVAIEEVAPKLISHLSEVNAIAKGLGAPPDVVENLNTAIGVSTQLQQIGTNLLDENYLGVIAGVVSLFGSSSQEDPEQLRFSAIMKELNVIKQLQLQTLALVQDISRRLDIVIAKLDIISDKLDEVKILQRETLELNTGFQYCQLVEGGKAEYLSGSGQFNGFGARRAHFLKFSTGLNREYFTSCLKSLDLLFSPHGRLSGLYHQRADDDATLLQARRYRGALRLLVSELPTFKKLSNDEQNKRLDRLFSLSIDLIPLADIPAVVASIEQSKPNYERFLADEKYDLLSVTAVQKYVNMLLEYHFYRVLLSRDSSQLDSPLEVQKRADNEDVRLALASSKSQLQQALRIVNTAIAQQQLLTGSLTLVAIDNRLSSYVVPREMDIHPFADGLPGLAKQQAVRGYTIDQLRKGAMSDALWLITYDPILTANFQKFILMAELYPEIWDKAKPFQATASDIQPGAKTYAAQMQDNRARHVPIPSGQTLSYIALNNHYCPEVFSWKADWRTEQILGCFRTGHPTPLFTFSGRDGIMFSAPAPPEFQTEFRQRVPRPDEIDPKSESLNVPALSPEIIALFQLKGLVLSALDQYTGFNGLREHQKCLAINLMLKDTARQ